MGLVLSHGIGISLNILLIKPAVVVVPLMAVMNFQMERTKCTSQVMIVE